MRKLVILVSFLLLTMSREYVDSQETGIANSPKCQQNENSVGDYRVFCFEVAEKLIVHLYRVYLIVAKLMNRINMTKSFAL